MRKKVCVRGLPRDVTCLKEFVFDFGGILEDSFHFWRIGIFFLSVLESFKREFTDPPKITILLRVS